MHRDDCKTCDVRIKYHIYSTLQVSHQKNVIRNAFRILKFKS